MARGEPVNINFFGKLDWQPTSRRHLSVQENRVRWSAPAGARGGAVVDRGVASLGNAYGKVDAAEARWVTFWSSWLSNEVCVAYGRDFEYETAQTPLVRRRSYDRAGWICAGGVDLAAGVYVWNAGGAGTAGVSG